MRYRHFIWDWNGTLVDDVGITLDITNALLQSLGQESIAVDRHREIFVIPIIDYYRALGVTVDEQTLLELDKSFHDAYDAAHQKLGLFEDAVAALEITHTADASHSILSALPGDILSAHIRHFGIAKYFRKVQGRDGTLAGSKIAAGRRLLTTLGLSPKEALIIGDTIYDYDVAAALGCDCALVSRGHQSAARLEAARPSILAESIAEVLDWAGFPSIAPQKVR